MWTNWIIGMGNWTALEPCSRIDKTRSWNESRFPKTIFSYFPPSFDAEQRTAHVSKQQKWYKILYYHQVFVMRSAFFLQHRSSWSRRRSLILYFQKGWSRYSCDSVSKALFSACLAGLHPYLYNDHLSEDLSYTWHNITFYIPSKSWSLPTLKLSPVS